MGEQADKFYKWIEITVIIVDTQTFKTYRIYA